MANHLPILNRIMKRISVAFMRYNWHRTITKRSQLVSRPTTTRQGIIMSENKYSSTIFKDRPSTCNDALQMPLELRQWKLNRCFQHLELHLIALKNHSSRGKTTHRNRFQAPAKQPPLTGEPTGFSGKIPRYKSIDFPKKSKAASL